MYILSDTIDMHLGNLNLLIFYWEKCSLLLLGLVKIRITVLCHLMLCGNSYTPSENTLEINKK